MDKQIEEMAEIMYQVEAFELETLAETLYNAGYRKIPEGAVVLTANEQVDRWIDLLVEFDEMGFEPTTLPPKEMSAEEYAAFWKDRVVKFFVNARKETAEKFAERLKKAVACIPWCETRHVYEAIDEIAKEITEGEV